MQCTKASETKKKVKYIIRPMNINVMESRESMKNGIISSPPTGAMQTGFVDLGSKTVYYSTTGSMCYGEKHE